MKYSLLSTQRGFTLTELMGTVASLAIIASVPYSTYQGSVLKARRAEAKALVLETASRQEQVFSSQSPNSYGQNMTTLGYANNNQPTPNSHYLVTVTGTPPGCAADGVGGAASCTAYAITAQAQGAQIHDDCGNFTLNQFGARGVSGTLPAADCW